MIDCVAHYKKELKKNLRCSGKVKEQLLSKFSLSLSTFLEDTPNPTMDELCTAFGSPKEMALVLMEEVTPEETARYRRNTIFVRAIAGGLAGVILFFAVAISIQLYLYKSSPIIYDDEIIVDEVTESGDDIIVEDEIIIED